jgi:acyl dehydratase
VSEQWWDNTKVGDEFSTYLVENLGRPHIAQYAGASGDFNSVHIDEIYATVDAGRAAVIAHGMLTMGLTSTFITSVVGHGTLRSFGGRFLAPVEAGDTLRCLARVTAVAPEEGAVRSVSIQVETRSAADVVVFRGQASATREPLTLPQMNQEPPEPVAAS